MAAPHACTNCRTLTTADRWLCDECQMAVNAEVATLGDKPTFADVDDARLRALQARQR